MRWLLLVSKLLWPLLPSLLLVPLLRMMTRAVQHSTTTSLTTRQLPWLLWSTDMAALMTADVQVSALLGGPHCTTAVCCRAMQAPGCQLSNAAIHSVSDCRNKRPLNQQVRLTLALLLLLLLLLPAARCCPRRPLTPLLPNPAGAAGKGSRGPSSSPGEAQDSSEWQDTAAGQHPAGHAVRTQQQGNTRQVMLSGHSSRATPGRSCCQDCNAVLLLWLYRSTAALMASHTAAGWVCMLCSLAHACCGEL